MKVIRAAHAGACYGVQRALDMAHAAAANGQAYTLGPLIHNPIVVSSLEDEGVHVAESVEETRGSVAIIRSHGVTPSVRSELEQIAAQVIDATCPHVRKAQEGALELAREGCRVIVVGEAGHPEVEGLLAYASSEGMRVDAVQSAQDVPKDLRAPIGVVVQTTQKQEVLDEVVAAIEAQGIEPLVKRTICLATTQRQKAAKELAENVDAVVVIGGRNSSNTTRLAEICAATGKPTYHIESIGEIDPLWFEAVETIGVTAGASTPEQQIDSVIAYLEAL